MDQELRVAVCGNGRAVVVGRHRVVQWYNTKEEAEADLTYRLEELTARCLKPPCQRCESEKLYSFHAKCADQFVGTHDDGRVFSGYVPDSVIGSRKYVAGTICLDCGQWQGEFPTTIPDSA